MAKGNPMSLRPGAAAAPAAQGRGRLHDVLRAGVGRGATTGEPMTIHDPGHMVLNKMPPALQRQLEQEVMAMSRDDKVDMLAALTTLVERIVFHQNTGNMTAPQAKLLEKFIDEKQVKALTTAGTLPMTSQKIKTMASAEGSPLNALVNESASTGGLGQLVNKLTGWDMVYPPYRHGYPGDDHYDNLRPTRYIEERREQARRDFRTARDVAWREWIDYQDKYGSRFLNDRFEFAMFKTILLLLAMLYAAGVIFGF